MLAPPSGAQGAARATDWWGTGRRAVVEWALPQAVVLGVGAALLWPLAEGLRRAAGTVQQALAAAGTP